MGWNFIRLTEKIERRFNFLAASLFFFRAKQSNANKSNQNRVFSPKHLAFKDDCLCLTGMRAMLCHRSKTSSTFSTKAEKRKQQQQQKKKKDLLLCWTQLLRSLLVILPRFNQVSILKIRALPIVFFDLIFYWASTLFFDVLAFH